MFEEPCATGEEDKQEEEPKLGFETLNWKKAADKQGEEPCALLALVAFGWKCFSCFWLEILVGNKIIYLVSNRFYFGLINGWCFY